MFDERKGQGATEYLLILAAVLVIAASAVYFVTQTGGYPAVGAVAVAEDNDAIRIEVQTGSIPDGEWEFSIVEEGNDPEWESVNGELSAPGVVIEDDDVNEGNGISGGETYSVSLRHEPTGHVYFTQTVTTPLDDS